MQELHSKADRKEAREAELEEQQRRVSAATHDVAMVWPAMFKGTFAFESNIVAGTTAFKARLGAGQTAGTRRTNPTNDGNKTRGFDARVVQ